MQVKVIGQQWWWEYRYDVDDDGESDIITANQLVIPAGEHDHAQINSSDVIHSFWIPALNGKKDAVPGRTTRWRSQADEPGVYQGQCTEFCGLSHANMRMQVVALSPDDYAAGWPTSSRAPACPPTSWPTTGLQTVPHHLRRVPPASTAPDGNEDLDERRGAPWSSGTAPNLTHLVSRGVFAGTSSTSGST